MPGEPIPQCNVTANPTTTEQRIRDTLQTSSEEPITEMFSNRNYFQEIHTIKSSMNITSMDMKTVKRTSAWNRPPKKLTLLEPKPLPRLLFP
ncbi:hypothetical protein PoB_006815900 [Plakobranchus ocellatus]|uniref:Uncharacterized protein n=1 Tax=Plakobranchus ocellatus TaxID=259542 RepID=A0AAV4DBW8_9GAST|nr:hypothetical protein PoB_006815900 [Plakobranchus ocellatus]